MPTDRRLLPHVASDDSVYVYNAVLLKSNYLTYAAIIHRFAVPVNYYFLSNNIHNYALV